MTKSSLYSVSPDLNPAHWEWEIMDTQLANVQHLCDVIMFMWTNIFEECSQHLLESMAQRNKAILKAKGVPTQY